MLDSVVSKTITDVPTLIYKMQSSVYVTASGPALSLLLYENTKTPAHQVGFLLGAVVNQVTDTISDSQMRGEKTETIISEDLYRDISSILPIPISTFICNGAGKIDKEKLSSIVKSEKNQQSKNSSQVHDIVGWYTLYRNSAYTLSMRQRIIHQQLSAMAKEFSQDCAPDLFVLCLLQNNLTSKATHVFRHSFMRYLSEKRAFDLIPLQIHNLGMSQLSQYQNTACAPSRAELLKTLVDSISPENQGKDHMLLVQSELQKLLNSRVHQLSDTENSRLKLEKDVNQLKEKLKVMEREQHGKRRLSSNGSGGIHEGLNAIGKQNNRNSYSHAEANADEDSETLDHNDQDNGHETECTSPVFVTNRRGRINKPASQEY